MSEDIKCKFCSEISMYDCEPALFSLVDLLKLNICEDCRDEEIENE